MHMFELFENIVNAKGPDQIHTLVPKIFDELPVNFYWKDKTGVVLGCNNYQAKTLGCNVASEVIGHNNLDFFDKPSAKTLKENDRQIMLLGEHRVFLENAHTCLNNTHWVTISCKTPLRSFTKKILGIMGITLIIDVTTQDKSLLEFFKRYNVEQPNCITTNNQQLTSRQLNCLYYLAKGMTSKQIASVMQLSQRTIEHHLENIKAKLNCNSKSALIAHALKIPIIKERL